MNALRANYLKPKMTVSSSLEMLREKIQQGIERVSAPAYVPTGIQEDIILWTGKNKHQIILALHPNDTGKTTAGAAICANLMWPCDDDYFAFWEGASLFRDVEFKLKSLRICSYPEHLKDTAAIQTEIKKWWPAGRYEWTKGRTTYYSECTTDTGWTIDALSYEQPLSAFESKKVSFIWCDEPPKADLIGAITSRFAEDGMHLLVTATPWKAAAFLDMIKDLEERGTRVKRLTATADENSITIGKPNHIGSKRGLRTDEQIGDKKRTCPPNEYDARILGKADYKAGKVYSDFDRAFHVKDYDLSSPYFKKANCFTVMDPHEKAYPFIQFWAFTEDKTWICYNEWPTYEELGNNFYDEVRKKVICTYTIEQLARFIKLYDLSQFGLTTVSRAMDPRHGKNSEGRVGDPIGLAAKFSKYDVHFSLPPFEKIEVEREAVKSLLKFDRHDPLAKPKWIYMPHCVNSIRMQERHYWDDDGFTETEQYKEGPDCGRILLAHVGDDYRYVPVAAETAHPRPIKTENPIILKMREMAEMRMG
jgi:hypothetical protein